MPRALKLHPDSQCAAAIGIEADTAEPRAGELLLRYVVTGEIGKLRLPPVAAPARADELWRRSCFEAFLRASSGDAYHEFNFAPSMQWAAYRFDTYRRGMRAAEVGAPRIAVRVSVERFEMEVALALADAAELPREAAWRLGLAAVIEEKSGGLSYWALAHPPGKADFHHADGFVLELPAA
jgi:hypothetical protein